MKRLYQGTAELVLADKQLNRRVGVTVSEPFPHYGLGAVPHVDVDTEYPIFNTATFGTMVPKDQWRDKARDSVGLCIRKIDALVAELQGHRNRLTEELKKL